MIKIIDYELFDEVINSDSNNIIIFTKKKCGACDLYLKSLTNYNTTNFYIIELDDDILFWRRYAKLKCFFPTTRVYNNGNILYENRGILYKKQIKEMYDSFIKV